MRSKRLFSVWYSKGISHYHLHFVRNSNTSRETGKLYSEEKRRHQLCPVWRLLAREWEKAMATHSSTLAWKVPWAEEPGKLQYMGLQLHFHFSLSCLGERNGNPLQCSCLENPRDGGAWWAAVSGVVQSRTRLKWLSSSSSKGILEGQLEAVCPT